MSLDIYSRDDFVSKYNPKQLEVSDDLSLLILQIENLLFTNKNEVLGSNDFGASLESEILRTSFSSGQIETRVSNLIATYCPLATRYNIGVNVQFYDLDNDSAYGALMDVTVNDKKIVSFLF